MLEDHEEEIFFEHPTEDIRCNQLGVLYFDEDRYVSYTMTTGSIVREHESYNGLRIRMVGSKHKIAWECFHGEILDSGTHFMFRNANSLDTTKDNLLPLTRVDKSIKAEASATKSKFFKASLEHLIKLEEKHKERGIESAELHKLLQLPTWLTGARKRWKGPVPKALAKKMWNNFDI